MYMYKPGLRKQHASFQEIWHKLLRSTRQKGNLRLPLTPFTCPRKMYVPLNIWPCKISRSQDHMGYVLQPWKSYIRFA